MQTLQHWTYLVSNHATWVSLLPGSDPTAFSAILRCRIGHTHTDEVLSDRSALTRYRVSADVHAPRKPAETDDIANTQEHHDVINSAIFTPAKTLL